MGMAERKVWEGYEGSEVVSDGMSSFEEPGKEVK